MGIEIEKTSLYKNFNKNDLLYGLTSAREKYFKALEEKVGYYITVDRFNNDFLLNILDADGNFEQQLSAEALEALDISVKKYYLYLMNHKKYNPLIDSAKKDLEDLKFRRSCKAALTWNCDAKIHFCLDGIDEMRVLSKWDVAKGKIDHSFTSAELRWIYKNWNDVMDKVTFYKDGEEVVPPWVADFALWANNYKKGVSYIAENGLLTKASNLNLKKRRHSAENERKPSNSENDENVNSDEKKIPLKRKLEF